MIRFIHCVKRHSSLSPEEFRRYWNSTEFSTLLEYLGRLTGAYRVEKNLTLMIEMNTELMKERGSQEPFDGILEVWFDNARVFNENDENSELNRLLEQMETYQGQFIDFSRSMRFFTEWNPPEGELEEPVVF